MNDVRVAAFIGAGIHEALMPRYDLDFVADGIETDFDRSGVPKDWVTRTAKISDRIRLMRDFGQRGAFEEVAYLLAYASRKKNGSLAGAHGIVAVFIANMNVDDMHIVTCATPSEYTAFIESMRKTVGDLLGRTVTWASNQQSAAFVQGVLATP